MLLIEVDLSRYWSGMALTGKVDGGVLPRERALLLFAGRSVRLCMGVNWKDGVTIVGAHPYKGCTEPTTSILSFMKKIVLSILVFCFVCSIMSCTDIAPSDTEAVSAISIERAAQFDRQLAEIMETHGINTAGVGVIKGGSLEWTGYFGEQAPGVPASEETLFNVASITKVITSETILRLVNEGALDLDESMASYWVDPDLAEDPRHASLTSRMALNHTTGFLNWRYQDPEGVLRFINDPGTVFGYSGEGFDYAMRYAQNKLDQDPESLVQQYLFDPLGIEDASYSVRESNFDRMAKAMDENGEFYGYYCYPHGYCPEEGAYSAADDMVISVEAFAKFLVASMQGDGLSANLLADRETVQTVKPEGERIFDCNLVPDQPCPESQGFGLGWEVLDYGAHKVLSHGGSDWSEMSLAYFDTQSKDGIIIFLNAPNALAVGAMLDTLLVLDPGSPLINGYQRWVDYLKSMQE